MNPMEKLDREGLQPGLPKGVRYYPPPEAGRKRDLESQLLDVFLRWGFQEIVTPTLDYYETLDRGLGHQNLRDLFKVIGRDTGELLTLRSDITPQIAHLAATSLKTRPLPIRLCYAGRIYRYAQSQGRIQQEFHQSGIELIGLESLEADAEVIAVAVESLRLCGLKDFSLILTHMGFLRDFLNRIDTSPEWVAAYREALARKDLSTLERLVKRLSISPKIRSALLQAPNWVGGPEVLDVVCKAMPSRATRVAMDELTKVLEMLDVYGVANDVTFDLSEVRGFNYYTGTVFEVFSPNAGFSICSGGRYDDLIGRFGSPVPATGFAVDVGGLLETIKEQEGGRFSPSGPDVLLIDFSKRKERVLSLARKLRDRGFRVARDIIHRKLTDSLEFARASGIRFAVVLGHRSVPTGKVGVVDLVRGREVDVSIHGLPRVLKRMGQ